MGKMDLYQSNFYDDPDRFADAFNGVFFHGEPVLKADELEQKVYMSFWRLMKN